MPTTVSESRDPRLSEAARAPRFEGIPSNAHPLDVMDWKTRCKEVTLFLPRKAALGVELSRI
jgi:hypothetical protein